MRDQIENTLILISRASFKREKIDLVSVNQRKRPVKAAWLRRFEGEMICPLVGKLIRHHEHGCGFVWSRAATAMELGREA
jgi:hypothetical protein